MGGGKVAPPSAPIDFESLLRAKEDKSGHHNYFLHAPEQSTSASHHFSQSTPQFDRSQYVTMNINMNIYPKVMNANHYQLPAPAHHNPHQYHPHTPFQSHQQPNSGHFAGNCGFGGQFQGQGGLQTGGGGGKGGLNITLDANINLDTIGKDKVATLAPTSWIDDWK
jgi:hypothetical protein